MPRRTLSFGERRRRALGLKTRLDPLENRSTVTPIGAAAVGLGLVPLARSIGSMHASYGGGEQPDRP